MVFSFNDHQVVRTPLRRTLLGRDGDERAGLCGIGLTALGRRRRAISIRRWRPEPIGLQQESTRIMPRSDGTHGSVRQERRGAVPSSPAWPQNPIRDRAAEGPGPDAAWPGCSARRRHRARVAGDAFRRRGAWSRHSRRTEPTQRSANAFAFGARMGVLTTASPSVRRTSSKAPENLASRSRSRMCLSSRRPVIARFRAC